MKRNHWKQTFFFPDYSIHICCWNMKDGIAGLPFFLDKTNRSMERKKAGRDMAVEQAKSWVGA